MLTIREAQIMEIPQHSKPKERPILRELTNQEREKGA